MLDALTKKPQRQVFPGWYVLAAMFFLGAVVYGIGLYSFYILVKPIGDRFGLQFASSGLLIGAFFAAAPLSLLTDKLIKRFGIPTILLSGIAIEATAYALLPLCSELWHLVLLRGLTGLGKILFFITLPIILSKWFSRRYGLATAVMACGWQLGGVIAAPATNYLVEEFGWQIASVVLGLTLVLVAGPLAIFMLRMKSAVEAGVELDGLQNAPSVHQPHSSAEKIPAVRLEISLRKNTIFLHLIFSSCLYMACYYSLFLYQSVIVQSLTSSSSITASVLSITLVGAAVGGLIAGYTLDRLPFISAVAIQYILLSVGLGSIIAFSRMPADWLLILHAISLGLAAGGDSPLWITILKRTMPDVQFQRAWGIWYFLGLALATSVPPFVGLLRDESGNFMLGFVSAIGLIVVSFPICVSALRRRSLHIAATCAAREASS